MGTCYVILLYIIIVFTCKVVFLLKRQSPFTHNKQINIYLKDFVQWLKIIIKSIIRYTSQNKTKMFDFEYLFLTIKA